jgi:hypothetical protein
MRNRILFLVLLSFGTGFLGAQQVLYSPFISNQSETRFQVIGKAGNYYWVQKSKKFSDQKNIPVPGTKEISILKFMMTG